jgi:hypothetical protein
VQSNGRKSSTSSEVTQAREYLFSEISRMQNAYPSSAFSATPINRERPGAPAPYQPDLEKTRRDRRGKFGRVCGLGSCQFQRPRIQRQKTGAGNPERSAIAGSTYCHGRKITRPLPAAGDLSRGRVRFAVKPKRLSTAAVLNVPKRIPRQTAKQETRQTKRSRRDGGHRRRNRRWRIRVFFPRFNC